MPLPEIPAPDALVEPELPGYYSPDILTSTVGLPVGDGFGGLQLLDVNLVTTRGFAGPSDYRDIALNHKYNLLAYVTQLWHAMCKPEAPLPGNTVEGDEQGGTTFQSQAV